MIYIFHNQRCRKSRECLAFLREQKVTFEIIYYLEKPPTFDQLKLIIKKLDINPIALVRRSEKKWIENYKNKILSDDEIIQIMVENSFLIERPIVINGSKAIVARPFDLAKNVL